MYNVPFVHATIPGLGFCGDDRLLLGAPGEKGERERTCGTVICKDVVNVQFLFSFRLMFNCTTRFLCTPNDVRPNSLYVTLTSSI